MGNTSYLSSAPGRAEDCKRRNPTLLGSSEHARTSSQGGAGPAVRAPARQSRPAALPEERRVGLKAVTGAVSVGPASVARSPSLHVARHVAERLAPGALEPQASVAEAVSSLTIADAFVAAGESPAPPPPPPALPRRFICSFPDCSANYNKAWKLDAHLCKHTGEVTRLQAGPRRDVASRRRDQ